MVNMLSWLTGRDDPGPPQPFVVNDGHPSLHAYNPTPSEQVGNWIQSALMSGGTPAYPAGHMAHGVRDLLSMSPLGIGMSAADLLHAKSAGDLMGAAAAAIGMVPGLKPEVQAVRQGIRAYHGSPHDFERFDISKIGTGEGAQAYGHGLYFAENEKVARGYRDQLAQDFFRTPKGTVFDPMSLEHMNVRSQAFANGSNLDATIAKARQFAESNSPVATLAKRDLDKLEALKAEGGVSRNNGSMYEVNINAKPEQFLDWDRSLRDQPQSVQKVFDDIGIPLHPRSKEEPVSGKDVYWWLNPDKRAASAELAEAGIPGIRYLDQGSRIAVKQPRIKSMGSYDDGWGVQLPNGRTETGFQSKNEAEEWLRNAPPHQINASSNYVLFNDQLVDIMRKYGLAAPAAAGTASYAMQPQEAQAAKAQAAQFQQPAPLSDRINQMIDSLQWGDQWQGRMRLPLQNKVNNMLGESVWPPLR